jgi:uncharacterized phage protein gp47/JayE
MPYFEPYIDAAGLHIPTYEDIIAYLLNAYEALCPPGVYLANDSAEYQFISVLALAYNDAMQANQIAYNSRGPISAIGAALDIVVQANGLIRKSASYSTCDVILTGTTGTVITGGIVSDVNGNQWSLPSPITIPSGGSITVTATCIAIGSIPAAPGNINNIATPTQGWTAVNNTASAISGQPAETDMQLRARQAISSTLPSLTLMVGTMARIAAIEGVTRYAFDENPTGIVDANAVPAHAICVVVEGGTDADIAAAIYYNKGPGCGTYGSVSYPVVDPANGTTTTIHFDRPVYVPIYVTINLTALLGYTTATTSAIYAAINGLPQ